MDISLDLEPAFELLGESGAQVAAGALIGAVFGAAAQRSRFCLRAASVEFADGRLGPRMAVWLLTFSTALFWTQLMARAGMLDLAEARVLAAPGSISGAALGGLMFGAGMILARGCSGRLLVLAAGGNLRALLSGLVFAVVAQMSLHGILAPLRQSLAELWTTGPTNVELSAWLGLGPDFGPALGAAFALAALVIAARNRVSATTLLAGSGVGFAVALGWAATSAIAAQSFDPAPVKSLTFAGPSADALMFVLTPGARADFDIGLIPGVALGAMAAAVWAREWRWEGFEDVAGLRRRLIGAALMGMGAMLAGGCAIGAGVTGTSALALTSWLALTCMWIGAVATRRLADRPDAAPETARGAARAFP
ncbi:YeeE/YedE family protein [Oceanicella actignis]|uniref:YeeE/YedE family protein n=1 Tax=Oceanicella actignis TaxID=1189325 RepID=UPI0011E86552|nr:YeeE/YedE family protein [Oceanicella actignis]TYO90655.1 sulfur transporter [Oceanicella actignis]